MRLFRCDMCRAETLCIRCGDGWIVVLTDEQDWQFCSPECLRGFGDARVLIGSAETEAGL